jgi:hypothetical protein
VLLLGLVPQGGRQLGVQPPAVAGEAAAPRVDRHHHLVRHGAGQHFPSAGGSEVVDRADGVGSALGAKPSPAATALVGATTTSGSSSVLASHADRGLHRPCRDRTRREGTESPLGGGEERQRISAPAPPADGSTASATVSSSTTSGSVSRSP